MSAGGGGQGEGEGVEGRFAGGGTKGVDQGSFSFLSFLSFPFLSFFQDKVNISRTFGVNTSVNTSYASPKVVKPKEPKEKKKSLFTKKEVKLNRRK